MVQIDKAGDSASDARSVVAVRAGWLTRWERFQETGRRTVSRDLMASGVVEPQEIEVQSDRCRHKFGQRFFSIPFFRVGALLGCRPPVIRGWECLRSRDGSMGIVLVGTSRTHVKVKVEKTGGLDDGKLPSGLAFQSRWATHFVRRVRHRVASDHHGHSLWFCG